MIRETLTITDMEAAIAYQKVFEGGFFWSFMVENGGDVCASVRAHRLSWILGGARKNSVELAIVGTFQRVVDSLPGIAGYSVGDVSVPLSIECVEKYRNEKVRFLCPLYVIQTSGEPHDPRVW